MSGLEPLVALGLACNVLQLVELGKNTISHIKAVYQGGKLDTTITENAAALKTLADEIKTPKPVGKRKYEVELQKSAEKCSTAARDLCEEVRFLETNARQGSLISALKVASKVTWRKRRLERHLEGLDQAEKNMQTWLLAQTW